jgi:hypothetical protein
VAGDRLSWQEQKCRATLRAWAIIVIAADLTLFMVLPGWDTGNEFALFLFLQLAVGFGWLLGGLLIRSVFLTD